MNYNLVDELWLPVLYRDGKADRVGICQGDKCLVIKENMSDHSYCMECAALILPKAREELACLITEGDSA
jgi:hypothetical protein